MRGDADAFSPSGPRSPDCTGAWKRCAWVSARNQRPSNAQPGSGRVYESTCCNVLHVVGTDGSGDRESMKNVYVPSPVWSPDGTRLVVKQNGSFTVLTVDGSTDPVHLPHSTDLGVVSWQTVMR